jgi:basic membrane protein A and related proteins
MSCFFALITVLLSSSFLTIPAAHAAGIKVALVFDTGGKDDRSFNASAYAGAMQAQSKLGAQIKYVEATDNNAIDSVLKNFSKKDFDLIIAIGVVQADALKKVAPQFPDKKYLIIDSEVNAPNVSSALFQEHEGSYLVGALAAMASKTGVIGFVGGMDIPLIRRFQMGYEAGAKKVNPKAKVIVNYVGVTGDAWHNPPKAKELALSQISSKADVIYHASGASGAGVFDAAEDKKILVIGVDSNQNWVKPGRVLTSMLKRVDLAVYKAIEQVGKNEFKSGTVRYGLKDLGIDWALDEHNAKLVTPEMKSKMEALKTDIISGKIKVPDYYTQKK